MTALIDGPASSCFSPVKFQGNLPDSLVGASVSSGMAQAAANAPRGACVARGIPFDIRDFVLVKEDPVEITIQPFQAEWLVFMHTADESIMEANQSGFFSPMKGKGRLNELAAEYVLLYEDGSQARSEIRMRHQVNVFTFPWGDQGLQCVPAHKPSPVRGAQEQVRTDWGWTQTRVSMHESSPWINWLWAWQNPHPHKTITGLRFEPKGHPLVISGLSAGNVDGIPLRWHTRRKAVLRLPEGVDFQPDLDPEGCLAQIRLDLGQVISAQKRLVYPNDQWETSYDNQLPTIAGREIVVEYAAHQNACFHLWDGRILPVREVEESGQDLPLEPVAPATRRVLLRVIDRQTRRPVAVKLHLHGAAGEYLPPVDRHRIINWSWFEDYSVDFIHQGLHSCSYINGETLVDLPQGKVYAEVSKGFEVRPVRRVLEVGPDTNEIVVELERVLPWREKGWVTADTHVHFLSPVSAMLEGAGEGVNIVNLLASQWGELMTNVGDFDGRTTWGSPEAGGGPEGNGEYMVRVGTENRQHVLGHISLIGYNGRIIAPMTNAGPDEAALGDPVDMLLTEWARQCRAQGGLVVLPHFPNPRTEHAASLVEGEIDAIEMTSWGEHYYGIDPYSLSDWYRYLNCGYLVPAVGGTDKMWSGVAVGTVRTYARTDPSQPFTYQAWMDAVRRGETFVSYGPLLDFSVNGRPSGSRIELSKSGGTLDITWQVASITMPVTRVDLIVNGEILESKELPAEGGAGSWSRRIEQSAWVALLVRGRYPDKPEIITAHSSPVMVQVEGTQLLAAADAVTILEQIEGALAYLDSIGTRADDQAYKRMRLVLVSAQRRLHNRMHQNGLYHEHTISEDHH